MSRSSSDSKRQYSVREVLQGVDTRGRGGTIGLLSHVPVPRRARLSAQGVLSWTWYSTQFSIRRATFQSWTPQSRKLEARFAERFAALAQASDEQIRRFAERWGPLRYGPPQPLESLVESVQEWRRYATLIAAIVRCGVALEKGQLGTADDWRIICTWLNVFDPVLLEGSSKIGRAYAVALCAQALNQWSSRAGGMNVVGVEKQRLVLRPLVSTLFGAIPVQVAHRLIDAQDQVACHHCGKIFIPQRRPRLGARAFCKKCRKAGKPQLYAMRDYRARLDL